MKHLLLLVFFIAPIIAFSQDDYTIYLQKQEEEKNRKEKTAKEARFNFPRDSTTGLIKYSAVVKVPDASAAVLHSKAKLFIAEIFRSNKAVTQLVDDVSFTVFAKPILKVAANNFFTSIQGYVEYQLKIECKDGKYRYIISNLRLTEIVKGGGTYEHSFDSDMPSMASKKVWLKIQQQSNDELVGIIELLEKNMKDLNKSDF